MPADRTHYAECWRVHPDCAVAEVKRMTVDLAECYRLSGADPDGDEDWRLARHAVEEVRRLRADYDAAALDADTLRAEVQRLHDTVAAVAVEADRYRLALESLTPGGSEYYRNPERCVEVIREMKQEPARIVARLKGEVDRLRGIIHQVGYSCRECRSDTGAVFLGDDLVASIHAALP